MKNKFKNSEKGFALPLALLLLVVMTIMGVILVTITLNEHKANTDKDSNQQAFYAAESGIAVAKKYMVDNTSIITGSSQKNLDNDLKCFPSSYPKFISRNLLSFFIILAFGNPRAIWQLLYERFKSEV